VRDYLSSETSAQVDTSPGNRKEVRLRIPVNLFEERNNE